MRKAECRILSTPNDYLVTVCVYSNNSQSTRRDTPVNCAVRRIGSAVVTVSCEGNCVVVTIRDRGREYVVVVEESPDK